MKSKFIAFIFVLLLLPGSAWGAGDKAMVLAIFGATADSAVTFDELVPLLKERFPDRDIVVPFTSGIMRKNINAKISDPAARVLSPVEALEKLKNEGYSDIAVVSTILFAGTEHDKLKGEVEEFAASVDGIKVNYVPPLLAHRENLQPVINLLGKYMIHDGANIVVTHGTKDNHPAEKDYMQTAMLVAKTYPGARAASIEGIPAKDRAMEWLEKQPGNDVRFVVFMFAAGGHVNEDIASDEAESFFSAARKAGKNPSLPWLDKEANRVACLGMDPDYRRLLLDYFASNVR